MLVLNHNINVSNNRKLILYADPISADDDPTLSDSVASFDSVQITSADVITDGSTGTIIANSTDSMRDLTYTDPTISGYFQYVSMTLLLLLALL